MRALRKITKKKGPRKSTKKNRHGTKSHLLRVSKEWNEWVDIPGVSIEFPKGSTRLDLFDVTLTPQIGYWANGNFKFSFDIPENYPIDSPNVSCLTAPIYHPNINVSGKICLNLLRPDWKPINTFENVIYGLILLFEHPNFNDSLPSGKYNDGMEPSDLYNRDRQKFNDVVGKTMNGGPVLELGDIIFEHVLS